MGGWSRASAYPLGLLMHMASQLTASDNTSHQLFLQGTPQGHYRASSMRWCHLVDRVHGITMGVCELIGFSSGTAFSCQELVNCLSPICKTQFCTLSNIWISLERTLLNITICALSLQYRKDCQD